MKSSGMEEGPGWTPGNPVEPLEQMFLESASAGMYLDFVGDGPVDYQAMPQWGPERTVRAAVLRHLLVGPQGDVDSKGVRLRGARISGRFDLESTTLRCPLVLEDCYLDSPEPVALDYATAPRIVLSRCRVQGGLTASLLVVTKELSLSGSTFEGVVLLFDADITGNLACRDTKLTGSDQFGNALVGDRMKVSGSVHLDEGFTAAGAVRLAGADITGQLSCHGARITGTNSDGNALDGDFMKVGSGAYLDGRFFAAGTVRLLAADITGPLSLGDAQLTGTDHLGNSLVGDGMKVSGDMHPDGGFTAAGAVRLLGADIAGQLVCRGAQFTGTNSDGDALTGDGMKVSGDVFLDQGFTAAGAVTIAGAHIGGSVKLNGAELAAPVALRAAGARVDGQLYWAPRSPVRGLVALDRTVVHRLDDDWSLPDAHWPPAGQLTLDGFTYNGFSGRHQASWRQRLEWIRRNHTTATTTTTTTPAAFSAQPYEQLARVYRQHGQEDEARQVAIARRNDLRRYGSLTLPQKVFNWLLDKTISHGYRPLRAVGFLVAVYVAVLLGALFAQHHDSVIVPAKDTKTITPAPCALHCSPAYPCFYPAGYAVDVVVPIINLRQAENWRPNGHAPWGSAYVIGGWVATGLGWAFTTLAVAGYTGLVRRD